ncbi:MAG: GTPase Era [Kofleriaceae bacterium]
MSVDPTPTAELRTGFCAIVGLPNVGKSTLLNRVLGQRLVAVSPKPQTTRDRILGVLHAPATAEAPAAQIAFVDTPGVQLGPGPLRRYMRDEAVGAAGDADMTLLVIDAADSRGRRPQRFTEEDAASLAAAVRARPAVIALNKVDAVGKPALLPLIEEWAAWHPAAEVVPISAITGDGIDRLVATIAARLPLGPAMFADDMLTDRDDRFLAAELIREQLYHQLGREVPYACAVKIEAWNQRPGGKEVSIDAAIIVERASQKGIVVGRGGARIKALGIAAREALAELLGQKVHLSLFVKVIDGWSQGAGHLRELGYGGGGS